MDLGSSFNDPEHADVLLHLRIGDALTDPGQQRRGGSATLSEHERNEHNAAPPSRATAESPSSPPARSLHAHAVILSAQSDHFKAQLSDRGSKSKPSAQPAAGSSSSSIRFEIVEQVEEDELEAMELLLRVMYSGRVDQLQDKAPALLLKALSLAHRFLASKACMGGLAAALCSISTEAIDQGFLAAVFHERMRDPMALPSLAPLLKACRDSLQQLYGDVPGVIASNELRGAFCSLPHAAVLSWLQLEGLSVHSENCVVLLLSYWVEAQEEAQRPCSPAELEQLAWEVRVGDVGPAYLACLLPHFAVFEGLKQFLPLMTVHQLSKVKAPLSSLASCPPPSWLLPARPRCPDPLSATLSWSLDAAQLEQLYAGQEVRSSPVYCNGYWLGTELSLSGSDGPASQALRLHLIMRRDQWPSISSSWEEAGYLTFTSEARIGRATNQKVLGAAAAVIIRSQGSGWLAALSSAYAATVKELVAPYLEEGRLNVKVEFKQVDQVRAQRG
jgi:hypothetical protein